ncbi:ABC transport system ATP-binding protein [Blastomyces silverae]|uniref:ABC multidrug transporter MDR2 n=1 Tax=Blastomyces silverae TaxID=2060906 RepID=A0A0H1BCN7_9EURO|nr:ABC transport system ATP-binding protein [Blastomyces silverae]
MRSSGLLAAAIPRAASRRIAHPGLIASTQVFGYAQKASLDANNGLRRHFSIISNASLRSSILPQPGIRKPFATTNHAGPSSIARPGCLQKVRFLSATNVRQNVTKPEPPNNPQNARMELEEKEKAALEEMHRGFELTEKASQAAKINLSARLAKDTGGKKAGFGEVWRLLKIARPEAKILSIAFVCLLVSSSITMSIPFSIGKILDIATHGSPDGVNQLFGLTLPVFYGVLGGVLALGAAANYGRIIILRIVGERIVARLRSKLFRRTFIQDAEFFDANRVGDLISRLSSDTIIVGKSITQNLSDGLRAFVSGAAGFGLMAFVSLKLSSVLLVLLPPVALGAFFYGRAIRNLSRKIQKNLGSLTKIAEERLGNVKTSQAFAGEILEVHRYNKQVRRIFELGKKESFVSATFFSSTGLMGNMTILSLLYVGGGMVQSGAISIGDLTSFLMYTAYAGSSMFGLSSFYSELMKGVGAASRLFELQDRNPTVSPTKGAHVISARGPIRFKNLDFSYPTRPAVNIFKDLDFEIPEGSNVAIVGPSGGGKSTIASMLLRFYNPTNGQILIDGKDISTMNAKSLRRKIGVVSQEPVLFSGTIAENISYGKPHATRAEIIAAARKANCQFISDFPDGLDTHVGARGAQLSGGQKQRIAIARALIKNPDILILDEATSALDAESETLVNSALAALLCGNLTTISIAHRLSTIKRSDTIVVLSSDGRVAEQGTYKDLSSRPDGAFTKLMEWQMSGGEGGVGPLPHDSSAGRGPPSEKEELQQMLQEGDEDYAEDDDAESESEGEAGDEGKVQKEDKEVSSERDGGEAAVTAGVEEAERQRSK